MPIMKCKSKTGKVYTYEITSDKVKEYRRNSTIPQKLQQSKRNAKAKGLEFALDTPFLKDLMDKQEGKCALTGVVLGKIGDGDVSPSIDRIDNNKGYTKDNVWWLAWRVNEAKKCMSLNDFISMCSKVSERATTIPKGSTSEANADGSGGHPW